MTITKELLQILACPDCHGSIKHIKIGKKETLVCQKCKRVFAVKNGIPIMMPKTK